VHSAGLVWDDKFQLYDANLRFGDVWWRSVFRLNFEWSNYFRPLGVALFAAETRIFDVAPAPMHLLSLVLHLTNTLLVGMLARSLLVHLEQHAAVTALSGAAMLLFGLHPILIEPVVWISSQFELLVTFFMLLGLLANIVIERALIRAIVVALCFFLAAGAKEAAAPFPLLLLVFDWIVPVNQRDKVESPYCWRLTLRSRAQRQWLVYLFVLVAGIAYLSIRYWGLGFLVSSYGHALTFPAARLQFICYTYLTYLKLLIWPMSSLGPIHLIAQQQFDEITLGSLATDAGALAIVAIGLRQFLKRKPIGGLIVGVSVALLPVLHIVPIDFQESFYHDRYAMTALAIMLAFLPSVIGALPIRREFFRRFYGYGALLGTVWLLVAIVNVRTTIPLWSDELRLWEWSLRENPGSTIAQDHLLSTFLDRNDLANAKAVADDLLNDGRSCANCMIKVAYLAVILGDTERASLALQEAKRELDKILPPRRVVLGYLLTLGNLNQQRHEVAEAEEAYRAAITLDAQSPDAHMSLAFLQARQGKIEEARQTAEVALSLCTPGERPARRREFEQVLAASLAVPQRPVSE